ncbi:hypothetical protein Godav_022765 [Gossypium davidsonii]|uniref:Peptidyl-tRNA hydrolase n=1 Tax=Gossypium davidsonii TaxID=34287 RepID=A0A7J8SQX3_GOSDV|nr:hypothetical protein [Gossypium davidsonii]
MITRRCFCSSAPRPWLFVGLGNPGDKYKGTRHNVRLICITRCLMILFFVAFLSFVGDAPLLLAKPQTYMNLSGESTGALAAYYKLPLNRVIVFHDDMDLPCGVLRLQDKGGHGSHNGYEWRMLCTLPEENFLFFLKLFTVACFNRLKSVIYHFRGNREFARLRIGIGKPPGQMDPKAFLLQKFSASARERIDSALQEGVEGLKLLLLKGLTESARRFNTEQKYKHIRLQTMPT